MFECARCGSAYNASHVGVEHCPRCLLLDRVQAPLAFKAFRLQDARSAGESLPQAGELRTDAQRVRPAR